MTTPAGVPGLIASFPAAGSGGVTLEQLEKLAARRGMTYLEMSNPAAADAFLCGEWLAKSAGEIQRAVERVAPSRVILVGHCMGGLSAIRLSYALRPDLARPVRVLVVNTPCPDPAGRIPTMSHFSDAEIAAVLAHDGFPQELLDDEDMLAEIADGLRQDATVADRIAEWLSSADDVESLNVLATRGDPFIRPEDCAAWRNRVSGEFTLTIVNGGHAIDATLIGVLERAIDAVIASAQAEQA
ncbi:MAG TPA: alpha/beta fold hydrolase [Streptosporangiaceae bacterium]|nr:alpha/beta fold hydrolase [Streptosporangiaceae bacterium]